MNDSNTELFSSIAVAISGLVAGIAYLAKVQTDLAQGAELTEDERAELDAKIESAPERDYWQPND